MRDFGLGHILVVCLLGALLPVLAEEAAPEFRPETGEAKEAPGDDLESPSAAPDDSAKQEPPSESKPPETGRSAVHALPGGLSHDDIRLVASADNSRPTIGDWVTYRIEVEGPEGVEFRRADIQGEIPDYMALRTRSSTNSETKNGRVSRAWEFTLDFFFSGKFPLVPVVVTYKGLDGKDRQVLAPLFLVDIQDLPLNPENQQDIRPIKPVATIHVSYRKYYLAGTAILSGLVLVGIGIILFFRWYRRPEEVPPLPAHVIAYEQMRRLVDDQLIEQGRIEEFHVRLSDICRHYLENRFGLRAPERTTEEFLRDMGEVGLLTSAHKSLVKDFLVHCDLVKFAQYSPSEVQMREAFDAAKRLVDETKAHTEEEAEMTPSGEDPAPEASSAG